jgi:hypothetical protein
MRSLLAWLAVISSTGCLLVPRHTKDEKVIEVAHYDVRHAPSPDLAVQVLLRESTVHVAALQPRACTRVHYRHVDVTEGYDGEIIDLGLGSMPNDPYGGAFAAVVLLLFSPVMLGSAIVTGIVVVATDKKTTRKQEVTKKLDYACSVPALQLSIALPSGTIVELAGSNLATFELPATEPDDGVLEIRAPGVLPRRIAYGRARSDCIARRQQQFAAAIAMRDSERVAWYRELPICNAVTDDDIGSEWAWGRTIEVATDAARGDCNAVEHIDPVLARLAPTHRSDIFAREPSIARCLGTIARGTAHDTCRARRSAALVRAQRISDVKQRGAMLRAAPTCD